MAQDSPLLGASPEMAPDICSLYIIRGKKKSLLVWELGDVGCNMSLRFVIYYFTLKCTKMWDLSRYAAGECVITPPVICVLEGGGKAKSHQLSHRINM